MDPDAKKMLKVASQYSYLGIFFGVAILLGYGAGAWLDGRFHTAPWLQMVGLFLGIAAGFKELLQLAKRGLRDQEHDDPGTPDPHVTK